MTRRSARNPHLHCPTSPQTHVITSFSVVVKMPSAAGVSLSEEQIDDILFYARVGQQENLTTCLDDLVKTTNISHHEVLRAAIDEQTGNGPLHMACANGHIATLKCLIDFVRVASSESQQSLLDLANMAGNTPVHWASVNGHLDSVKLLADAGADLTVKNNAGHDALHEAETGSHEAVAEWLLVTKGRILDPEFVDHENSPSNEPALEQEMELKLTDEVGRMGLQETP